MGRGLPDRPFISCDDPNLVIDTVKRAEDDDAMIVRLFECHGARGTARVRFAAPFAQAAFCNLLEDELSPAAQRDDASVVLNAIVGAAGLDATLAALAKGKRVALANKESLVVGGELVQKAARAHGGSVVPVDSEHSAILQCCAGRIAESGEGLIPLAGVRRLVITASGGPFRTWDAACARSTRRVVS